MRVKENESGKVTGEKAGGGKGGYKREKAE